MCASVFICCKVHGSIKSTSGARQSDRHSLTIQWRLKHWQDVEYACTSFLVAGREDISRGISPHRVAQVIERALNADRSKLRHRVGNDAHMLAFIRRYMPDFVFQMGLKRQF
jgi:hypothetical protein